ncbi:hypothetical protein J6590_025600 [Homalodisca vitripennis]|nr:hypothetical protein J6590_025600 [Homalodisca vitripennis]
MTYDISTMYNSIANTAGLNSPYKSHFNVGLKSPMAVGGPLQPYAVICDIVSGAFEPHIRMKDRVPINRRGRPVPTLAYLSSRTVVTIVPALCPTLGNTYRRVLSVILSCPCPVPYTGRYLSSRTVSQPIVSLPCTLHWTIPIIVAYCQSSYRVPALYPTLGNTYRRVLSVNLSCPCPIPYTGRYLSSRTVSHPIVSLLCALHWAIPIVGYCQSSYRVPALYPTLDDTYRRVLSVILSCPCPVPYTGRYLSSRTVSHPIVSLLCALHWTISIVAYCQSSYRVPALCPTLDNIYRRVLSVILSCPCSVPYTAQYLSSRTVSHPTMSDDLYVTLVLPRDAVDYNKPGSSHNSVQNFCSNQNLLGSKHF